jgi:transposase-like protein
VANTAYSTDFRDRVLQCYLNRGTRSTRDVAREFGISHGTLFGTVPHVMMLVRPL